MTLLAAYSFGGTGSTIADDSGNGRSFTLDANTVRAGGGGLTRTTNGNTVGPSLTGLQTANRSITCRVARTSTSQDGWFPTFDSGGTGVWGLIDLGGQRQARGRNAGGVAAAQQASTTGEVALAATYDGTNLRLYVGGSLVATTALAGPLRTDATQFLIFATTGSETVLKDLRIYSHTLNLTEVQADRDTPVSSGASFSGNVALSGAGTLANAGKPAVSGSRALSGSGTLANSGSPAVVGSRSLAGSGSLAAAGAPAVARTAALTGSGTLTGTATVATTGSRALSGAGTLTATGTPGHTGTAALAGAGSLTAAGQPMLPGNLSLSGGGLLLLSHGDNYAGAINLAGAGALTASGKPAAPGALSLVGSGGLAAIGVPAHRGAAQFGGNGQLAKAGSHGPGVQSVQSVLTATHAGPVLATSQSLPDLSPSNAPSSQLEVSHGV